MKTDESQFFKDNVWAEFTENGEILKLEFWSPGFMEFIKIDIEHFKANHPKDFERLQVEVLDWLDVRDHQIKMGEYKRAHQYGADEGW